jgi:hypothetical protein
MNQYKVKDQYKLKLVSECLSTKQDMETAIRES